MKKDVLDPQGKVVSQTLQNMGYKKIQNVRQGKFFEIEIDVFRVNFRSKGKYIINDIAKAIGGGGHKFAAGSIIIGDSPSVITNVLNKIKSSLLLQNKEKNWKSF